MFPPVYFLASLGIEFNFGKQEKKLLDLLMLEKVKILLSFTLLQSALRDCFLGFEMLCS